MSPAQLTHPLREWLATQSVLIADCPPTQKLRDTFIGLTCDKNKKKKTTKKLEDKLNTIFYIKTVLQKLTQAAGQQVEHIV